MVLHLQQENYILLILHNPEKDLSFLFVSATKVYQFKEENSKIKGYALCLGNFSKDFIINNMEKTELKGVVKTFSVDFNLINTNNIIDIHKYVMERAWC